MTLSSISGADPNPADPNPAQSRQDEAEHALRQTQDRPSERWKWPWRAGTICYSSDRRGRYSNHMLDFGGKLHSVSLWWLIE